MNSLTSMNEAVHILRRESVYIWYYFDLQLRQIFGYWVLGMMIGSAGLPSQSQSTDRRFITLI